MNQHTSNTLFLGSVLAGVALVALIAPSASATEPVSKELCTDTICVTAPAEPVVEIAPLGSVMLQDAAPFQVQDATYTTTTAIPSLQRDTALPDTLTVLGRIEQDDSSAADPLLGTQPAHMPSNMSNLDRVDSVTGLGIVSTF